MTHHLNFCKPDYTPIPFQEKTVTNFIIININTVVRFPCISSIRFINFNIES